jgi:hypothetical protein
MSMRYASRRSESAGTRNRRLVIGTVAVSTPALSGKPTEIPLARLSPTAKEDDGWWRYRQAVGTKAERRAAREHVTAYHEARLGELIEYITAAGDRYRAGEIDAYDVDEAIHHYHRAARELWKFCWSGGGGNHTELIAGVLDRMATDGESINWWDRVAPLQRD